MAQLYNGRLPVKMTACRPSGKQFTTVTIATAVNQLKMSTSMY
ncbi:hypothetical protein [Paenibacillus lentus]|nr:hypothetical protein [Paenibacillus lentus]